MTTYPTAATVREIAAIADHAARNHAITTAYFSLSTELRRRLPGAANWCTFATWASRQAGVTIRHEDLLEALRNRLRASAEVSGAIARIQTLLPHRRIDLVQLVTSRIGEIGPLRRASEAVGAGNRKVFGEIGFEFARLLHRFDTLDGISDEDLDDFSTALPDSGSAEGLRYLRQAFRAYRSAARTVDPQDRAEWLLLGNLSIGYYEQLRVQPEIRAALDAAVVDPGSLATALLDRLGNQEGTFRRLFSPLLPFLATPLRRAMTEVAEAASAVVREVVTEHLMTLRLDRVVVRLGRDIQQPFPIELLKPRSQALIDLIAIVDPNPDDARGSGAMDWADFPQRMHFIAEVFRAWQQDESLFASPDLLPAQSFHRLDS
jgi:hypothetical protein